MSNANIQPAPTRRIRDIAGDALALGVGIKDRAKEKPKQALVATLAITAVAAGANKALNTDTAPVSIEGDKPALVVPMGKIVASEKAPVELKDGVHTYDADPGPSNLEQAKPDPAFALAQTIVNKKFDPTQTGGVSPQPTANTGGVAPNQVNGSQNQQP